METTVSTLPEPPVPLSHLSLDLDEPPIGWVAYLNSRSIEIVADDLGRSAIARTDAKRLIAEEREREVAVREKAAAIERQMIDRDREFRSQFKGVPADRMPPDVHPAAVMLQASKDAQPKRRSLLHEALSRTDTLTFHSLAETPVDGAS